MGEATQSTQAQCCVSGRASARASACADPSTAAASTSAVGSLNHVVLLVRVVGRPHGSVQPHRQAPTHLHALATATIGACTGAPDGTPSGIGGACARPCDAPSWRVATGIVASAVVSVSDVRAHARQAAPASITSAAATDAPRTARAAAAGRSRADCVVPVSNAAASGGQRACACDVRWSRARRCCDCGATACAILLPA